MAGDAARVHSQDRAVRNQEEMFSNTRMTTVTKAGWPCRLYQATMFDVQHFHVMLAWLRTV